ncbi:MAG TPA: PIN domain-containing protein [Candidatus Nanoarchaeia archaeon]|nr:PIN domain-containing protein [Candidatus Nanoarchaeia archaeon]
MNDRTEIALIDTNVLVYAYDTSDNQRHEKAKKLLERCWRKEVSYAISSQNLGEFFIIITKKVPHPLSVEEAEQIITDICSFSGWIVIHYTQKTLQQAIKLYKIRKKQFWDTMIIATMIEAGVTTIFTENEKDFSSFQQIKAINPFR